MTLQAHRFSPDVPNPNLDPNQEKIMNAVFLKIKLKSLAAEARIIRRQELKTKGKWNSLREDLYIHRTRVVRRAARETGLAYGFIRGRAYPALERTCEVPPDWKEVGKMVKKYGGTDLPETWYKR